MKNHSAPAMCSPEPTATDDLERRYPGAKGKSVLAIRAAAERQELVDQLGAYALLSAEFAHQMVRPLYRRFIAAAQLSGALKIPRDVVVDKIADALYVPQSMPWIDPQKEANDWATLEANHYIAAPEIIRRRGGNPRDVLKQAESWNRHKREYGLDAATPQGTA